MKSSVVVLALAMTGMAMKAGTQAGTVSDGIVLEASRMTNFLARIELRDQVTITTEDFVLHADAADFFSAVPDRRIEARGSISVFLNPKRVDLLRQRLSQIRVAQDFIGPNHPDMRTLLDDVAKLEALRRKVEACVPGERGLKVELPPARRVDPRESFLNVLNGAPEPLREFRCAAL
jgi:hypothetical protein